MAITPAGKTVSDNRARQLIQCVGGAFFELRLAGAYITPARSSRKQICGGRKHRRTGSYAVNDA